MIIFSEATVEPGQTLSALEVNRLTEIARMMGSEIFYIPKDFSVCENAENALWQVPDFEQPVKCLWVGFIPSVDRYTAIFNEALRKNIHLLNTPEEHQRVQEFDFSYPLIKNLTPESVTVSSVEECKNAADSLGFPVFVRGSARSNKAAGWKACVANNPAELEEIVGNVLSNSFRSRGRAIIRKLVSLKYSRVSDEGFPLGREFRVFIYQNQIAGYGYYWDGDDPLMTLSASEEKEVLSLAGKAAELINVPFVAVDVGQLTDGSWIVIEVNDAQFAGAVHMELLEFWNKLIELVEMSSAET